MAELDEGEKFRVLLLAPSAADSRVLARFLDDEGFVPEVCVDGDSFVQALHETTDAAIIAEEALRRGALDSISEALASQPDWSELPLILLTVGDRDPTFLTRQLWERAKTRVIVLERPIGSTTFLAAVQTAVRSRRRQYQIRDELERRVIAERVLREKAVQLADEDRKKDLFLATLGHELRNPLAGLHLELRLLEDGGGDVDRIHARMAAQIRQLTTLVNDLLEVSRISRGKVGLQPTRTDLVSIVESAVDAIKNDVAEKKQRLTVTLPRALPLEADATRIGQVLSNLLSNASKYTPSHGRIEVDVWRDDEMAVILVRDSGKGLRPDELTSIFEPFVQGDPLGGGLGIGLSLVKGLVELHHGSITVQSEGPGTGAAFEVRIPLISIQKVAESHSPVFLEPLSSSFRVLIIDDNRAFCDSLAVLVRRMGAAVLCAHDGSQGLRKAGEWNPDAVVVDIGLPDIDGYEVARIIRSETIGQAVLLIAITGFGDRSSMERIHRAGFDDGLIKPIDPERLHALFARSVASQRQADTENASLA